MRVVRPPGDKSISHRALILGALGDGESHIRGILRAADVRSTAAALRSIGVPVPAADMLPAELSIKGPAPFRDADRVIDCGNSGTSARLLLGLLAGTGVGAVLDGDESLRGRPMDRVVYPLQAMGARISYRDEPDRLPVRVEARSTGRLRSLTHRPRVASAQVKSALLLAGLTSGAAVRVVEPAASRDHTELLLSAMGAPLEIGPDGSISLAATRPGRPLRPLSIDIPGDPSSAMFLIGASLLARRPVHVEGVTLNPTRTGFLQVLHRMGADIEIEPGGENAGEPIGDLVVRPGPTLRAFDIGATEIPGLLDEIPALAVLAATADGVSTISGAAELRLKESDRLGALAGNLSALGVQVTESSDGLEIRGAGRPLTGSVRTFGDHRIAMAFAMLAAEPGGGVALDGRDSVEVSFPGFFAELEALLA